MIKLPDAIVIYPQKKDVPSHLLCWIPAKNYAQVAKDQDSKQALAKYYPNGIEVDLSPDGFDEAGIRLSHSPEQLREAYMDLSSENLVPESGMVEVANLVEYINEKQNRPKTEILAELVDKKSRLQELDESDLARKIGSPPPMTEGEDARQVYQRLSIQRNSSDQKEGGE